MINTLLKKTARTLYFSAAILPRGTRGVFSTAYLLCRAADTVADTNLVPYAKRLSYIKRFPRATEEKDHAFFEELKNELSAGLTNKNERALLTNIHICIETYAALPPEHQKITLEVLRAVCAGMEFDLSKFPPNQKNDCLLSDDELKDYCAHMGGAPGVFWAKMLLLTCKIKGDEENFIFEGKLIGDAMQITNIVRDLKEDLDNNRCYLPARNIDENNVQTHVKKWLGWGIDRVSIAPNFYYKIPRRYAAMRAAVVWPVIWMLYTYAELFKNKKDLLTKKIKFSKMRIYLTFIETPLFILSNTYFRLRVRRLISQITSKYY